MTDAATPGQAVARWWANQLHGTEHTWPPGPEPGPADTWKRIFATKRIMEGIAELVDRRLAENPAGYCLLDSRDVTRSASGTGLTLGTFSAVSIAYADHVVIRHHDMGERLAWQAPGWDRPECGRVDYDDRSLEPVGRCALPKWHEEPHEFAPHPEPAEVQP